MVVFDWTDSAFFSSTHNQSKPSHSIRGRQMVISKCNSLTIVKQVEFYYKFHTILGRADFPREIVRPHICML